MCGEIFWKGVVVFCLAFGLSVFVSCLFTSTEIKQPITIQPETKEPQVLFTPKELKKTSPQKPLCKSYSGNRQEVIRLIQEDYKEIIDNKKLSEKQRQVNLQKIKEIQRKLSDFYKKQSKEKTSPEEYKPTHNLLYVENCDKY